MTAIGLTCGSYNLFTFVRGASPMGFGTKFMPGKTRLGANYINRGRREMEHDEHG